MSNNRTDILVQQFRKSFELSQFGAQLVQTANFLSYFYMAIPAALVMQRWGCGETQVGLGLQKKPAGRRRDKEGCHQREIPSQAGTQRPIPALVPAARRHSFGSYHSPRRVRQFLPETSPRPQGCAPPLASSVSLELLRFAFFADFW
jgi:hypothetical protein